MTCPPCRQLADHQRPGAEHRAVCQTDCTCQHHDPRGAVDRIATLDADRVRRNPLDLGSVTNADRTVS